ncbi:MAG: XkdF-like putative serine protease domain-containing protein [Patescibacteria group bacterium]
MLAEITKASRAPAGGPDGQQVERVVSFKKVDSAQQIVYGEVYVPNVRDTHGNWMTAEEIEKMAHRFLMKFRNTQIDLQHDMEPDEGVVVESFVARPGDPDFTPGAWVLATKVFKTETWQAIMNGEITGYSLYGLGVLIPDEPDDEGGEGGEAGGKE